MIKKKKYKLRLKDNHLTQLHILISAAYEHYPTKLTKELKDMVEKEAAKQFKAKYFLNKKL